LTNYNRCVTLVHMSLLISYLLQKQGSKTDSEFAGKIGIDRVSWNRIKNNKNNMSIDTLQKITKAFGDDINLRELVNIFLYGNVNLIHNSFKGTLKRIFKRN